MNTQNNSVITVGASIKAPVEKVWKCWTRPEHITKWNQASDVWHSPRAENDLRAGGKFITRMEAKDGSAGFDFGGTYDEVTEHETIAYTMDDGRKVEVRFSEDGKITHVTENFDPKDMNSREMQRNGWQSILDNFKNIPKKTDAVSQSYTKEALRITRKNFVFLYVFFEILCEKFYEVKNTYSIMKNPQKTTVTGTVEAGSGTTDSQILSKKRLWTARIMGGLVILFMLLDAIMKFIQPPAVVEGTLALGYAEHHIAVIGVLALISTLLYAIPRTSVLGAILLTGYWGGAIASNLRMDLPLFSHILFPVYIAILAWGSLWLVNERLRELLSFNKKS